MNKILVLQSDFGLVDGAVSAMYGVALAVDPTLKIYDLTHDIPLYNTFEASYRLIQTVQYWPQDTVFVSVVDPGVGTNRKSVAVRTKLGHYVVTPDNGSLTHLILEVGLDGIRQIEEDKHLRANSETSYTFHGRDLYAYVGAKLAAGVLDFSQVGHAIPVQDLVILPTTKTIVEEDTVTGSVDILDVRYGNLWTSIDRESFLRLGIQLGEKVEVSIFNNEALLYNNNIMYDRSFAAVKIGGPIVYVNSLYRMGIAINQGSFAKAYTIGTGKQWRVVFRRAS